MAFAESSLSTVYVGTSTTHGTEPAAFDTMQPTAHSLSPTSGSFEDETIDPSGDAIDKFRINKAGQGDISGHFRPGQWDGLWSCALRSAFSAPIALSPTVTFGTPSATTGLQTVTDDGVDGFATVPLGSTVLIGSAVTAGNNGLKLVVARTNDQLTIYNPGGASGAADAVTVAHEGSAAFGTTKIWAWIERLFTDGTNLFYSEYFKNGVVTSFALDFPAQAPTRCVVGIQSDSPVIVRGGVEDGGSVPITKQRTPGIVAVSGDRLVHGMEDVQEIVLPPRGDI